MEFTVELGKGSFLDERKSRLFQSSGIVNKQSGSLDLHCFLCELKLHPLSGPLAQVWAPYDFHVNAAFSHCGVDSFILFKTTMSWQVASISYTVKPHGCTPSPLGPLAP